MLFVLYTLPWLIILMSLSLLFIDIKKPQNFLIAIPIVLFCVAFAVMTNLLIKQTQSDQDILYTQLHEQTLLEESRHQKETLMAAQILASQPKSKNQLDDFSQFGLTLEATFFNKLLHVDALLTELKGEDVRSKTNHYLQIYRIPDNTNQLLLTELYEAMGYQVSVPVPIEEDTATLDDPAEGEKKKEDYTPPALPETDLLNDKIPGISVSLRFARKSASPSAAPPKTSPPVRRASLQMANHLLIGKEVPEYDVKIIALTAIRAGIELKAIRKIPALNDNKRINHIEFAHSKTYRKKATLDPDKLLEKRSF